MVALASDINRQYKLGGLEGIKTIHRPLEGFTAAGAYTAYKGAIMSSTTANTLGFFNPHATPAAATDTFGGINMGRQHVGADAAADGSLECACAQNGVFGFPEGSITQADVGKLIYAVTDNDVSLTALNNLWIGTVAEVRDGQVWIDIKKATGQLTP